jgi:hypothetical protein
MSGPKLLKWAKSDRDEAVVLVELAAGLGDYLERQRTLL